MTAQQRNAQRRIVKQLAEIGLVLPGTVLTVMHRCGNPGCRCRGDPPQLHGPYVQWTRKVNNKTVTRRFTEEQLRDYQPFFDNARTLKRLVAELEHLSVDVVESDPRWQQPIPRAAKKVTRAPRRKTPAS